MLVKHFENLKDMLDSIAIFVIRIQIIYQAPKIRHKIDIINTNPLLFFQLIKNRFS